MMICSTARSQLNHMMCGAARLGDTGAYLLGLLGRRHLGCLLRLLLLLLL